MINRRSFIAGFGQALLSRPQVAMAHRSSEPFSVDPAYLPQPVEFPSAYAVGTVVVDTAARFLYLVVDNGSARATG